MATDLDGKGMEMLSRLPNRHLSEVERQFISLKLEQAKLQREKARLVLEKGIFVYLIAFVFALVGKMQGMLDGWLVNVVVIAGIIILLVSIIPYIRTTNKEQASIEEILEKIIGK